MVLIVLQSNRNSYNNYAVNFCWGNFWFRKIMKYKLAIFDFDGTLADTFPFFLSLVDHLADKYHIDRVNPADIEKLRGLHAREMMQHFQVPFWKLPIIGRHVKSLMARNIDQISLFDGIDAVIKDLSDLGIILVVVSSNSHENIVKVLGMDTAALFDHFECGSSIFGKSGRFKKVLKKFKIDPSEVIAIGDEIRDIEASQKMNIPCGAVSWGYTKLDALLEYEPTYVFNSVSDIRGLLAGYQS
jgi:phosphoglycolate phosphatase